jgi:hypothetical protein
VGRVHRPLRLSHVVSEASSFSLSDAQLPFMCVHVCVLVVIELGVYVCVFVRVIRLKL